MKTALLPRPAPPVPPAATGKRPEPARVGYVYSFSRTRPAADAPAQPTNMLWGAVELAGLGHDVRHFYPSDHVAGGLRRSRLIGYLLFFFRARRELAACDVLYVNAHNAVYAAAAAKALGFLRTRLLFVLGAVHIGLPRGGNLRGWFRLVDRIVVRQSALVLYLTDKEAQTARDWTGLGAGRIGWIRFGVDTRYYRPADEPVENYVVAVGNDANRDWDIVAKIARLVPDIAFRLVTHDPRVKAVAFTPNVEILSGLGFTASRQVIARAKVLLLATRENIHFSGMTTVMNAMCLGTPVLLDEAYEMKNYGLTPPENCLHFPRGNAAEAAAQLRLLFTDAGRHRRLRQAGLAMAEFFSMTEFGRTLSSHVEKISAAAAARSPQTR